MHYLLVAKAALNGANVKVLFVPNYSREAAVQGARQLAEWLEEQNVEVAWAPDKKLFPNAPADTEDVNLVVSLGGDGTLLRAARLVGYQEIPIMGISYGHLGFLTCGEPGEMLQLVEAALAGELHASKRATLDIEVEFEQENGSAYREHHFALNDMSLTHGAHGDMIVFDVAVSGHHIDRLRGDGFVVSTATGSTGYALAAGGPIVTPEFKGMVCVPVAPHTLMARAFLTAPSDVVEIAISDERNADRLFYADGQPIGDGKHRGIKATVRRGPSDIILLDHSLRSFYESVSRVFYGKAGQ